MSWARLGWARLGWARLGWARLGWAGLRSTGAFALAGCTLLAELPSVAPEESARVCADGVDQDLDGETDCADASCSSFCYGGGDLLRPDNAGCFQDTARDLTFEPVDVDANHTRCEPDPPLLGGGTGPSCGAAERLVPGAPGCRAPGTACSGLEWPMTDGRAQHVRAGAVGGDGSASAPWGTLAAALVAVEEGGHIVLAEGELDAPPAIRRAVVIRGLCGERSVVRGPLRVEVAGVELEDLAVRSEPDDVAPALTVTGGVVARGVIVDGAIVVEGADASLELDDAWVRVTGGVAADARAGGRITLTETVVDASEDGVRVSEGELAILAAAVRGTSGVGVALGSGARTAGAVALVVEPRGGVGLELACVSDGARCAELEDVVVRVPVGSRDASEGIVVRSGEVSLRRVTVLRTHGTGVRVGRAQVLLEDAWVQGADVGGGVVVEDGGALDARRTYVWDHQPFGLRVEAGGRLTGAHLEVAGAMPGSIGSTCIEAREGSSLLMSNFRLATCEICGLGLEPNVALELVNGLIIGNSRGTCLSPMAEYAVGDLTSHVTYQANSSNLFQDQ